MSSILYYITGHGYGHAVRSNQVIDRLNQACPDLKIYVRSTAPGWLFKGNISQSRQSIDVGIVQKDSLDMDLEGTLQACQALHRNCTRLIAEETDFIKGHQIRLIVGDIPPIGFEVATRAAIASVGVGNFTWSRIYRAYIESHPGFVPLIEEMENFYRHATLALTLPYPCGMDVFPRRKPIPWITRTSVLTKQEARKALHLPQSATLVLLSFGGLGLNRMPWTRLKDFGEFFFVTTGKTTEPVKNVHFLPEAQRKYEDLVRAVDVIVTKPGYGIVADIISHQVRVLYTDRGEFAEYSHLVRALDDCATAEFIPQDELLTGNLGPYLARLLSKKESWPATPLDGAEVAAAKILELV
ncbi:MAG TPA: glycosyltransferase family protein [Candidatus Binatia bacterium]|nr:glycosyltransferase family protein [Candidatus Binatia bacterium]